MGRKSTQRLVDEFDEAALHWGWQQDQGANYEVVCKEEAAYKQTKAALLRRINQLEEQIADLALQSRLESAMGDDL